MTSQAIGGMLLICAVLMSPAAAELPLTLRFQTETSEGSGRYHTQHRGESWKPAETAIIVCDMWDSHHSQNAVRRAEEFAPRLNRLLAKAREQGVTIIHAPSNCMDTYAEHPARKRAVATPKAAELPEDITKWCYQIPAEENADYPIDQSDGGEDDDPDEHAAWLAKLEQMGLNPRRPWKKQMDLLTIDPARDYISDRGDEVWSILAQQGIDNVILTGVHTNMCVLGRPFGLRQMAQNGKNVVLMRDLTDTMYNPQRRPFVSHFTGTDLIVSHIERHVCPTVTSDQILGGKPFRFKDDKRPHVAIVTAEDEYETEITLPQFALKLGKDFRVSLVFGNDDELHDVPGLNVLDEADVLLVSVRRRVLRPEQLEHVRRFVDAGKPVVGIRTSSHAFSLRGGSAPPEGHTHWPEFDAQVFGGNYQGHHGNNLKSTVQIVEGAEGHPVLTGVLRVPFSQGGSLYKTSPLASGTTELLTGRIDGHPAEPVAWTFKRADGGRSFYTSMGHKADFENPAFVRLLLNSVYWAAGLEVPKDVAPTMIGD